MPQAIVITEYGDPEVMQLQQVARQPLARGQVRVRNTRIGVNFHDIYVRSGAYKTLLLPGTPGMYGLRPCSFRCPPRQRPTAHGQGRRWCRAPCTECKEIRR